LAERSAFNVEGDTRTVTDSLRAAIFRSLLRELAGRHGSESSVLRSSGPETARRSRARETAKLLSLRRRNGRKPRFHHRAIHPLRLPFSART
jgi:hypothetical protein